ncbi:unnamed protein product [Phytophthora fragariaefolia]|uniref:Unnamed protein product n=1 Tax=Phytophthora fragariaefolia TaxID=1490495 RepID=A0A9W6U617_9STRA|nr:unnamed protein product [Phytophthora fragariaefolia]
MEDDQEHDEGCKPETERRTMQVHTLDLSGWKSRSTSDIGSRHQADLDLKLDGSGSRGWMDGFRNTGLWCILIQEPQTQIQATVYCLPGRSFASQDPRSRYRKRQAQERKRRKGKGHPTRQPRPDPDPEYWIYAPPHIQVGKPLDLGIITRSTRRTAVGGTEADPDPDLEDKPQFPPEVPSGTPVDLDPRQDPPTQQTKAVRERYGFDDSMAKPDRYISPSRKSTRSGGIQTKQASTRVKMKAPDPEGEDPIQVAPSWSDVDLEYVFHQKELRDFLALDPVVLMLKLKQIGDLQGPLAPPQMATGKLDEPDVIAEGSGSGLFDRLKALVGGIQPRPDPVMPDPGLPTHIGSTGCRTASPHVSAAEGSETSSEPRRMSLGASGAAMLQVRSQIQQGEKSKPRSKRQPMASVDPTTSTSDTSAGRLETYFQAAMSRFLKEQQALPSPPTPTGIQNPRSQDVEMESTGSPDLDPHWEYDPDDIDVPTTDRAAMATMTTGSTGYTMIQRVRISAISDLKEFSSKSTRNKWTDLLRSFQIQYCGFGVSVARQYCHARKRSDESVLEYLHRLNVAGLRVRLKIKDGIPKENREHVDHFIETLGDQELTDRLALLRLLDADELEEVLRALDRAKTQQKESAFGSSKYRQKAPANPAPAAAAKHVRAIQIQTPDSGYDDSGSERSDSDCDEHRRICTAANQDNAGSAGEEPKGLDRGQPDHPQHDRMTHDHRSRIQNDGSDRSRCTHCGSDRSRCTHCGSKKHTDLGCWRRLTCDKCGKRGHPADHCLFVCRGCGELHDMGKCPMEEFYNQIRQWFNPAKHAGMLPAMAEKMLN